MSFINNDILKVYDELAIAMQASANTNEEKKAIITTMANLLKLSDLAESLKAKTDLPFVHLALPVYFTQQFKSKPAKTFLVNLNWYRNAHYYIKNEVKQHYNAEIITQLKAMNAQKIKGAYELAFVYYYKSITSDLDNVCAMANKAFNDAAQSYGLVENDNVKFCKKSCYYVAEQDKENPRVEIFIRQLKD